MIIYRYLTKEVFSTLLASTVVLLLIFMSNQFVHYLRYAAKGQMTAHLVLWLLWLRMPVLLSVLLPLSLFLTILLVYGRMYVENEMTVLFACGVSRARLMKVTTCFAVIVAVLVAILALWIGPSLNRYAARIINQGAFSPVELIQPARFQSIQKGKQVIYVEKTDHSHKVLQNVFVVSQTKSPGILAAKTGYQKIDPKTGDKFLEFKDGTRYAGVPGQKDYQITKFSKYGVLLGPSGDSDEYSANAMPTSKLWHNRQVDSQFAELQWRISMPVMVIILSFMAVPLSRVKTRHGRYSQLVPAILLYIIYGNFMFMGRSWLQDGIVGHVLGMWWVHVIMALVAAGLLMQQFGWLRIYQKFNYSPSFPRKRESRD